MKIKNRKQFHTVKLLMVLLIITSFIFSGYRFAPNNETWMTSPTGSAKHLDGTTVLVSLFVEDPSSSWTAEKKEIVMSKMDLANDFLVAEGNSYGKSVNLIYDIYEHPDLAYTVSYHNTIDDSEDCSYDLLDYMTRYINSQIPTQQIMSQYGVDSIAYMCFLDKSGVSYTFPYYEGDSDLYYYETCFMFLKCDGDYEPPAVYAHEMLHLFGARDLYASNEYDGITKDFVQYIETNYPNEIMLTTYDENWNNVQDYVSNDLTDITAYFIGWKDSIPELGAYPSIATKNPASFSEYDGGIGDYSEYTAGDYDYDYEPGSNRWGSDIETNPSSGWGTKTEDDFCSDTDDFCSDTDNSCSGWGSGSCDSDYDYDYCDTSDIDYDIDSSDDSWFWDLVWWFFYYLFE